MEKRLADIQKRVKNEHKDIVKFAQHVIEALDQKAKNHRILVASNALAGIKINGEEEKAFYASISEFQKLLLEVLEQTIKDFEHLGDKRWEKIFKDGVDE